MSAKLVSISIVVTLAVLGISWLGDQTGSSLYELPLECVITLILSLCAKYMPVE